MARTEVPECPRFGRDRVRSGHPIKQTRLRTLADAVEKRFLTLDRRRAFQKWAHMEKVDSRTPHFGVYYCPFPAAGRLCCFEINHQLELGRLLDWDIARPCPAQNLVGELSGAAVQVGQVWSIGHQASRFHEFSKPAHHRQSRSERQRANKYPVRIHKWVGNDVQRIRPALEQLERRIDVHSLANL